jgi:ribosomal protein L34
MDSFPALSRKKSATRKKTRGFLSRAAEKKGDKIFLPASEQLRREIVLA